MIRNMMCGLAKRRPATVEHWAQTRAFSASEDLGESVFQPFAVLHDQHRKGSCVGQDYGQGIEGATGDGSKGAGIFAYGNPGPRVSSVDLWEGGRILQGDAGDAETGTRSEYVIRWLERHGWTSYVTGEDERPVSEDTDHRVGGSLADRMRGHGARGRIVRHQVIDVSLGADEMLRRVVAALRRPRTCIGMGGGCTEKFFDPPANTVLGPDYRGGRVNGHSERIVGWDSDRGALVIQGSWGKWTWCRLPNGAIAYGCYLASPGVLGEAWEVDVFEVAQ